MFLPPPVRLLVAQTVVVIGLAAAAVAEAQAETPRVHALTGARVVIGPGEVLPRGTVVIRDGVIEAVGADIAIPADARVWNAESLVVYPGLIDPYVRRSKLFGQTPPPAGSDEDFDPVATPATGATHPNRRVHPQFTLSDRLDFRADLWTPYHALGITTAFVVPDSGIFRGEGAILNLRPGRTSEIVVGEAPFQCLGYDTGGPRDGYPRSLMGVVALMRQTFLDARHDREARAVYAAYPDGQERPLADAALQALEPVIAGRAPVVFETTDVLSLHRSWRIAQEFGLRAVLRGSGDEYKRIPLVQSANAALILPVAFPDPPAMETDDDSRDVTLQSLRAWDHAPSNPARLEQAGVSFALTTDLLADPSLFWSKIRVAMARGLREETVLRALTVEPARILGLSDRLGTIEAGKIANLVVADGKLFARDTRVRQIWVDGNPSTLEVKASDDARGLWQIERLGAPETSDDRPAWLWIRGAADSLTATLSPGAASLAGRLIADSVRAGHDTLWVRWPGNPPVKPQVLELRAGLAGEKQGTWLNERGEPVRVRAVRRQGPPAGKEPETLPEPETPLAVVPGPNATPRTALITNATLWTCGPQGIVQNGDLLVQNGKIVAVGPGLKPAGDVLTVDATGLSVTPGIMDCHSHTAGVGDINEGTLSSSAMVRLGDIVNSESRTIYEQLAGGVTAVNMLHGSANCMGGQSQVLKLRWGADPEAMKWTAARPGIKFALGENVTQKSWGDRYVRRYPKTRMGVEQFDLERFSLARDYELERREYDALPVVARNRTIPPRRDLELDCLAEILRGERDIHCHSYRQDEILMLMRLAERLGFRIAVFQHILEGYKVADEMARHGVGASAFSDWWTFKPEVYDAIPYAGSILHHHGVNVTYNSDSSELARRLNLEASKAVKYGAVPEIEALKFVTTNVAKQLGVDRIAGTLEPGKDADFAIWNGSPLSTGSICLQTWIDGKRYFDRKTDLDQRPRLAEERRTLIEKARRWNAGASGDGPRQGPPQKQSYEIGDGLAHCMPHEHEEVN
ncbi:MAG: amidohydrolase family protein [Candidatus Eisenbacteria bacterium]|nr:amidohydrolase family protein [Candidatus Eisenbacteria bacterium]MCC7143106.1 amidohydrolase family protein [Candidatus Eisenbacteria bacterium]